MYTGLASTWSKIFTNTNDKKLTDTVVHTQVFFWLELNLWIYLTKVEADPVYVSVQCFYSAATTNSNLEYCMMRGMHCRTSHQNFKLWPCGEFSHLPFQVRISVKKSRAHTQSLKLELLSLETSQTPPVTEINPQDEVTHKMKRSELVKVLL